MMKIRLALSASALALLGAASFGAFSSTAEAQTMGGGYYYGPPPVYYYPPPPPPPSYYYPAPAYYYPPPPAYYYPAPAYYDRPSYLLPGISANFIFGFGGGHHGHGGGNHWGHH
jgi:hypothetical protein